MWQGKSEAKAWWSDYSWMHVYFGACAVLWTVKQDERCALHSRCFTNDCSYVHLTTSSARCWSTVRMVHGSAARSRACQCRECSIGQKLDYFALSHLRCKNCVKNTPCGLTFITEWGSCRHAAGCAAVMAVYARQLRERDAARATEILDFARKQVR